MTLTKETFLRDVATHTLKVVKADGVHRHLHCREASGSSTYHFDIITWPGYLTIAGDCGTYTFWRLDDMFTFFRKPDGRINESYWAEKVEAADRSSGLKAWDEVGFRANVTEVFNSYWDDVEDPEARAECWAEVTSEVLGCAHDQHEAIEAASGFEFGLSNGTNFTFTEYWELGSERFTDRFLWCCHAIVWAIQQFDAANVASEAA
jgi:hypothetical protein